MPEAVQTTSPTTPTETTTTPASVQETSLTTESPIQTTEKAPTSLLNEKVEEVKGAPEKYEDFKVPEGFELDPEVSKEAVALFKDAGMSQEKAQKMVDFYVAKTKESFDAPYKAWSDMQDKWIADIKADPELGGKLDDVKLTVARALDGLGEPKLVSEFKEAMNFTGAGNNPAFIRLFYKMAQQLTEGRPVTGNRPSPGGQDSTGAVRPTAAHALYPNNP